MIVQHTALKALKHKIWVHKYDNTYTPINIFLNAP